MRYGRRNTNEGKRMKRKLLVLLTALAMTLGVGGFGMTAAHATGCLGTSWNDSGTDPSPYYGSHLASLEYCVDSNGIITDIIGNAGVGANYTTYPSTWDYPSPGIHANWLTVVVSLQWSDDGTTLGGYCQTGTSVSNLAGVYSASVSKDWADVCQHQYLRLRVDYEWNAGGLGWHVYAHSSSAPSPPNEWDYNNRCFNVFACP